MGCVLFDFCAVVCFLFEKKIIVGCFKLMFFKNFCIYDEVISLLGHQIFTNSLEVSSDSFFICQEKKPVLI